MLRKRSQKMKSLFLWLSGSAGSGRGHPLCGARCQTLFLVLKTARKNQEQSLTPSPKTPSPKSDTVPAVPETPSPMSLLRRKLELLHVKKAVAKDEEPVLVAQW